MYDIFSVRENQLLLDSQMGLGPAPRACTSGKRSKHFLDNIMNVVLLFFQWKLVKMACFLL